MHHEPNPIVDRRNVDEAAPHLNLDATSPRARISHVIPIPTSTPDTNDHEVREALREFVRAEHGRSSNTLLLEEFALYGGQVRADLAALNGVSHGYEIKSGRDTLRRLPQQVRAYNAVFEQVTLVCAQRHLREARPLIPAWWGLIIVQRAPSGVCLGRTRQSRPNPSPDSWAIAALLWRPEALRLLEVLGLDGGMRSKTMWALTEKLAATLAPDRLSYLVRQTLRARGDWQSAARRKQCDGTFQQRASLLGCRRMPYGNKPR